MTDVLLEGQVTLTVRWWGEWTESRKEATEALVSIAQEIMEETNQHGEVWSKEDNTIPADNFYAVKSAHGGFPITVVPMPDEVQRITSAPAAYDAFGTYTVELLPWRWRGGGNQMRRVAIHQEHLDWQTTRYASGMYACKTDADFEQMTDPTTGFGIEPMPTESDVSCEAGTCINHQECARARINAQRALKGLPPKWPQQSPA